MKILFKDARILSMYEGEEIYRGDLLTDGDTIAYVGKEKKGLKADRTMAISCSPVSRTPIPIRRCPFPVP